MAHAGTRPRPPPQTNEPSRGMPKSTSVSGDLSRMGTPLLGEDTDSTHSPGHHPAVFLLPKIEQMRDGQKHLSSPHAGAGGTGASGNSGSSGGGGGGGGGTGGGPGGGGGGGAGTMSRLSPNPVLSRSNANLAGVAGAGGASRPSPGPSVTLTLPPISTGGVSAVSSGTSPNAISPKGKRAIAMRNQMQLDLK
jgi:hypothetical protein